MPPASKSAAYVWLVPGMATMFVLFLVPIVFVARDAVFDPHWTLDNIIALTRDSLYRKVIDNSVVSALEATAGCLLLGYPTAYGISIAPARLRTVVLGALLISLAVGTVPRTFSWLVMLGDNGVVNKLYFHLSGAHTPIPLLYNQAGVLVGMIHVMLPYMVLLLLGSMMRVKPTVVLAARTLGASPTRAFWRVFLPLTMRGVLAGSLLVFIYSLGFYLVPAVLGGAHQTTVVMQIQNLALKSGNWGMGAALSTAITIASVLGAALYVKVTGLGDISRRD
jgi:putative spermidine/putrescine transport system permease protein